MGATCQRAVAFGSVSKRACCLWTTPKEGHRYSCFTCESSRVDLGCLGGSWLDLGLREALLCLCGCGYNERNAPFKSIAMVASAQILVIAEPRSRDSVEF